MAEATGGNDFAQTIQSINFCGPEITCEYLSSKTNINGNPLNTKLGSLRNAGIGTGGNDISHVSKMGVKLGERESGRAGEGRRCVEFILQGRGLSAKHQMS